MISIKHYVKPETIDEAYQLLQKKSAAVLGGSAYLRMGSKIVDPAIDLCKLNLDCISEKADCLCIGAQVSFGTIERSEHLNNAYNRMLQKSVQDIVGVQFRNLVTIGATVYSRYGFSDPNTALLAIGGTLCFASGLEVSIEAYFSHGLPQKDILTEIHLPKSIEWGNFIAMRNSFGDYALLNMAMTKQDGQYRIAVGARPQRSILATKTMAYLNTNGLNSLTLPEAAEILAEEITFGSNRLAGAEYRKAISKMLFEMLCKEAIPC